MKFVKWIFLDSWGDIRLTWIITSVILCACVILAGITAIILWVLPHNVCNPPYHLVYTGWHYQLVGKILVPVNDYACES